MRIRGAVLVVAIGVVLSLVVACGGDDDGDDVNGEDNGAGGDTIDLMSEVFEDGGAIPEDFTCDGRDHSPPLRWGSRPDEARALAIIMDDLDADFVHWLVYDLDPELGGLDFIGNQETLPGSAAPQGLNSFGEHGYGGPCPPEGDEAHTYRFRLFVLDEQTGLDAGVTIDELEEAMNGHILAEGELAGTYSR